MSYQGPIWRGLSKKEKILIPIFLVILVIGLMALFGLCLDFNSKGHQKDLDFTATITKEELTTGSLLGVHYLLVELDNGEKLEFLHEFAVQILITAKVGDRVHIRCHRDYKYWELVSIEVCN